MSMHERLQRFGFVHVETGGGCTAYYKALPDVGDVYINRVTEGGTVEGEAPCEETDLVCVGAYPMRGDGEPVDVPVFWWDVEIGVFLAHLEDVAGREVAP